MAPSDHIFGGEHTETKLKCLRDYLHAFSTALKKQNFAILYIDAFAGTGARTEVRAALPIIGDNAPETVTTQGSADIALRTTPAFHHITLIEQDPAKIPALTETVTRSGHSRVQIRHGDANEIVKEICQRRKWRGPGTPGNGVRGVIFLDPYGMEVDWSTVKAIAETEALDCWYFFPLSGLYRNAPHNPFRLDPGKIASLNRVLGTDDWRTAWYNTPPAQSDMFGMLENSERRIADVDAIESYVRKRLQSVFKGAVLPPLRIYNSASAPLASLFFAISNPHPAAVKLASDMASHILRAGISSQRR